MYWYIFWIRLSKLYIFMIYANCQHTIVPRIEDVLQENIELPIEVIVSFLELFWVEYEQFCPY